MKRGFGPFDWQELLITFIAVCMTKEKKHVMMQMTTGYGKSPTASVLAKLLIDTTDHNVIFVCLTPYLKHTALARYGWEQQTR
jgi:type I site-specific restriction endonuclease